MKLDTDSMTASERVLATIRHEEPDRAPCFLMGIPPYSKCFKEFEDREEHGQLDEFFDDEANIMITPMGDMTLKYFFGADLEMTSIGVRGRNSPTYLLNPDDSLNPDPSAMIALPKGSEGRYVSDGQIRGIKILATGEQYNWYLDGFLKKKEDAIKFYDEYGWNADMPASKANVEAYEEFQQRFGDRMYLIPQIGGQQLYESMWVIMGQARFAYYCRKDPDYIHRLVNDRKEAQLHILDEIARYKPAAVFGGDDLGQKGRPLMSPDAFRTFFKEPYREIFVKIHDMGAIAFNHSCGNMTELLADYIDAGLDGWQSLEPASLIDHAALKKKYGDRFLFVGGLDSREISFGTTESLQRHVRVQLLNMGIGGGYIPGPTHDFLTETPLDNCMVMRDAIQQLGKYPLC
ncbi:MAG TPA: uroporphyrinogen decarboxylase family protein [Candidatus Lokiarchaeia archaeon]|nr:uroporphyrinogen decarboxylase family protein [Candidatus Lokiarchaeia archaeon]